MVSHNLHGVVKLVLKMKSKLLPVSSIYTNNYYLNEYIERTNGVGCLVWAPTFIDSSPQITGNTY